MLHITRAVPYPFSCVCVCVCVCVRSFLLLPLPLSHHTSQHISFPVPHLSAPPSLCHSPADSRISRRYKCTGKLELWVRREAGSEFMVIEVIFSVRGVKEVGEKCLRIGYIALEALQTRYRREVVVVVVVVKAAP
ncbi:hypothetical protein E2C01_063066 [Portunus trituberculatus]|uniref:Uncharacterized protein n=1 Tax=Portunus trituberculatus TaxID=210409 RepID=A0A5B7HFW9_PORTR|nr:hypothetical protein [Portunus trituberculatus]